jgi:hypothetical protein
MSKQKQQRRSYTAEQKAAIVRRHLVDKDRRLAALRSIAAGSAADPRLAHGKNRAAQLPKVSRRS